MKPGPFKLQQYFARYHDVTRSLSSADCDPLTPGDVLSLEGQSLRRFQNLTLAYGPPEGDPILRKEIASQYERMCPEDVLVLSGANEAIFLFAHSILEKGDHVIVQFPTYQPLYEIARAIGCEITLWKMDEKYNWGLDIDLLKKHIRKNTKAIIISNPHNPTGSLMSQDSLRTVTSIARKHGALVLSDEVFRLLEYRIEDRLPAVSDIYDDGLSIGDVSKSFGLGGIRIGWIATRNSKLLRTMCRLRDYTTICNCVLSEYMATIALRNSKELLKRNTDILSANLSILNGFFGKWKNLFSIVPPRAGTVCFPGLVSGGPIGTFCDEFARQRHVILIPGGQFDWPGDNFRVGFGRSDFRDCLKELDRFVEERSSSIYQL